MTQKSYSDPVLIKIAELKKEIPCWATLAADRMGLKPGTIHSIARGTTGFEKDRSLELLAVMKQLKAEREEKIQNLTN